MKKFLALILCALMALSFTACSSGGLEIAVPNDTTNEARALLLLEANGTIKLKEGDILIFEEEGRGYIKPVEDFVTIEEAIGDLTNIKDLG